jgi:hypothetical protein
MELDNELLNQEANKVIEIYKGLGWMTTALSPELFDFFWKDYDTHTISKLRSHLYQLDKDTEDHFQKERKETFKKAAERFLEINTKCQKLTGLKKVYWLHQLKEAEKKAFRELICLIARVKDKKD